jgi:hypothetical protein
MSPSSIGAALNQVDGGKVVWALAIAESLHNIEEAIWLPAWPRVRERGIHQSAHSSSGSRSP